MQTKPAHFSLKLCHFMTLFLQDLWIFWDQVCKNLTLHYRVTWPFVRASQPENCFIVLNTSVVNFLRSNLSFLELLWIWTFCLVKLFQHAELVRLASQLALSCIQLGHPAVIKRGTNLSWGTCGSSNYGITLAESLGFLPYIHARTLDNGNQLGKILLLLSHFV